MFAVGSTPETSAVRETAETDSTEGVALVACSNPAAGAPGSVNINPEVTLVGHWKPELLAETVWAVP